MAAQSLWQSGGAAEVRDGSDPLHVKPKLHSYQETCWMLWSAVLMSALVETPIVTTRGTDHRFV